MLKLELALAISSLVCLHGRAALKHELALAVGSFGRLHGCAVLKHGLVLAVDSLIRSSALAQKRHDHFGTYQPRRWPASATRTKRPAALIYVSTNISYPHWSSSYTYLQLNQHQLPTTIIQLHTSMTQPTSATRNDHPAAHIYDSTNISYLQRLSSCFSSTTTIQATDTNHLTEDN